MSASLPEFTVNDLAGLAPRWDKLIAADLVREVENDTSERVETIDEMRLFLAIKGLPANLRSLDGGDRGQDRHSGLEGDGGGISRIRQREARPVSRDFQMSYDRKPGMDGRFYSRAPVVREGIRGVRSGRPGRRSRDEDS